MTTGFLRCDKPAGITSHDVVGRVRRAYPDVRVGHSGTLDPFATGLLIVLLGPATRLQRYVLGLPKTYVATARLGWRSTTGDRDGELTETGNVPERLELPTGRMEQQVPMTSAVRVDGERLYKKARRGEEVERPVRTVEVTRAELIASDPDAGTATFEIDCSSGTYIRSLIEQLGDAYCSELRRTVIGPLRLGDAPGASAAPEGSQTAPESPGTPDTRDTPVWPEIEPVEALVPFLPELALDEGQTRLVRNGIKLDAPPEAATDGPMRLTCDGSLIAIASVIEGKLKTEVVLPVETVETADGAD